jgi:hypothetical protein
MVVAASCDLMSAVRFEFRSLRNKHAGKPVRISRPPRARCKQGAELNLVEFRIPPDELGLVRGQKFARMQGRHDRSIDFIGADSAGNGI